MHWYNPNVGKLAGYPDQTCNVDPIVLPPDSYTLHTLLYGAVFNHRGPAKQTCQTQVTAGFQMTATDFTTWKLVTHPSAGGGRGDHRRSMICRRCARRPSSCVGTPRPGFFTTPAFGANWPTNTSNQMRVTLNQSLIVATGMAVDGNDATVAAVDAGARRHALDAGERLLRLPSAARSDALDPAEHLLVLLLSAERSARCRRRRGCSRSRAWSRRWRRSTTSPRRWRRIRRCRRRGRRSSATG